MSRFRPHSVLLLHERMAQNVRQWDQPSVPPSLSAYLVHFGLLHLQILGKDIDLKRQLLDLRYTCALSNSPFAYAILSCWTRLGDPRPGEAYENALRVFLQHEQDRDVCRQTFVPVLELCVEAGWSGAGTRILSALSTNLEDDHERDNDFALQCLNIEAGLADLNGNLEISENVLRRLLNKCECTRGRTHPETLRSLNNLAATLEREGRLTESADLFRDGLARTTGDPPTEHHVLSLKSGLALVLTKQRRYQEAENLCREVLGAIRQTRGPHVGVMVSTVHNLAWLLLERGERDKAHDLFRQTVEMVHGVWGSAHPKTLAARHAWGCFFHEVRQLDDAATILSDVLHDARETYEREHRNLLPIMNSLASVLQDLGRHEEAERLYSDVIAIGTRVLGSTHATPVSAMNNLATLKADKGDWPAAATLCGQVLDARMGTLGPDHAVTVNARNGLARAMLQQGQRESAENQLVDAYQSILRNHSRGEHVPVKVVAAVMSGLKKVGRTTESEDLKLRFGRKED